MKENSIGLVRPFLFFSGEAVLSSLGSFSSFFANLAYLNDAYAFP
jgi:hypothetical protein